MTLLSLDEDRFLRIQRGAVALAETLRSAVDKALAEGVENVFFVGAGGAGILMEPAFGLLSDRSTLPAFCCRPPELVASGSPHLGPRSLVVMPSLSGTTPDSMAALAFCKASGARVLTLTGDAESPLALAADLNVSTPAADDTSSETFYVQSLLLVLFLLQARGEMGGVDGVVEELVALPDGLLAAKHQADARAAAFVAALGDQDYHVIVGSHGTWPEAHYYGMCILEEMQWIRTRPVRAADFFHGTLELVEPGTSVLLLAGEDSGRALVQRVERFVRTQTDLVTVFDSADYPLTGLSTLARSLVSPVVLATVLERVSAHLERHRDHPLTTRRYYRRLDY